MSCNDIECPYCGAEQDICHDDGHGYAEGETHEQYCDSCEKTFGFETSISFDYEPKKVECFNGAECKFEETSRTVVEGVYDISHFTCAHCGAFKAVRNDTQQCTPAEQKGGD